MRKLYPTPAVRRVSVITKRRYIEYENPTGREVLELIAGANKRGKCGGGERRVRDG